MYIALADKYNNIVGNTNTAKATVRVDATYNNNDASALQYSPVLTGNSSFQAIAGAFIISGISFTGSPGYNFSNIILSHNYLIRNCIGNRWD
jgi:hypothetical protein